MGIYPYITAILSRVKLCTTKPWCSAVNLTLTISQHITIITKIGQYFCRQREESAVLEVIQSGKQPEQVSWEVTRGINRAKDRLKDSGVDQMKMDKKIDVIINLPMLKEQQRETTYRLLEAEEPAEIVEAMWEVLNAVDLPPEEYAIAMEAKMKVSDILED